MKRHKLAAASAVAAALLSASGCGIQSTSINAFSAAVAAPASTPSSGQTTTTAGKYTFYVYLLQSGNTVVPVLRTSNTPPTMQSVVSSLVERPTEQGYSNALTKVPEIAIAPDDNFQQEYTLDQPYDMLPPQAHWQLICTVWQFAQQIRPDNATSYRYSVRLISKGGDSGWHDCTEFTNSFPQGTKFPATTPTSQTRAGVAYPSSTVTGPGFTAGSPTGTPGG